MHTKYRDKLWEPVLQERKMKTSNKSKNERPLGHKNREKKQTGWIVFRWHFNSCFHYLIKAPAVFLPLGSRRKGHLYNKISPLLMLVWVSIAYQWTPLTPGLKFFFLHRNLSHIFSHCYGSCLFWIRHNNSWKMSWSNCDYYIAIKNQEVISYNCDIICISKLIKEKCIFSPKY